MAKKTVRRAQIVETFGVGSIIDLNGEGFVIKDTSLWQKPRRQILLPRLSHALGNIELQGFPDADNRSFIPIDRFPRWYFCSNRGCRLLKKVLLTEDRNNLNLSTFNNSDQEKPVIAPTPKCPNCKDSELTPMRWIAYCDHGHMAEIDWYRWCHTDSNMAKTGQCNRESSHLTYESLGARGGDFDQLVIKCSCGSSRSLEGINSKKNFQGRLVFAGQKQCTGTQPWEYESPRKGTCDQVMRVEPRGSSALYRPKRFSALDLGRENIEDSHTLPFEVREKLMEELNRYRSMEIDGIPRDMIEQWVISDSSQLAAGIERIADDFQVSRDESRAFVQEQFFSSNEAEVEVSSELDLIERQAELFLEEFNLFRAHQDVAAPNLNVSFLNPNQKNIASSIGKLFSWIGSVRKIREVRAILGFTRGDGTTADEMVPVNLAGQPRWIPAVEAWGEGIYFELNRDILEKWEETNREQLTKFRSGQLENIAESKSARQLQIFPDPFFVLGHTLSHLLIRELTFMSGYSSSALRERLYFDETTRDVGILVYTTDSDAEGTLGGLVEQARETRLSNLINRVATKAVWCSLDPVCRETIEQGLDGLNTAACHSCSLISETSCTYQNAGLNRMLLGGLGREHGEILGFIGFALSQA